MDFTLLFIAHVFVFLYIRTHHHSGCDCSHLLFCDPSPLEAKDNYAFPSAFPPCHIVFQCRLQHVDQRFIISEHQITIIRHHHHHHHLLPLLHPRPRRLHHHRLHQKRRVESEQHDTIKQSKTSPSLTLTIIIFIKWIIRTFALKIKFILWCIIMHAKDRLVEPALGLEGKTCSCFARCPLYFMVVVVANAHMFKKILFHL